MTQPSRHTLSQTTHGRSAAASRGQFQSQPCRVFRRAPPPAIQSIGITVHDSFYPPILAEGAQPQAEVALFTVQVEDVHQDTGWRPGRATSSFFAGCSSTRPDSSSSNYMITSIEGVVERAFITQSRARPPRRCVPAPPRQVPGPGQLLRVAGDRAAREACGGIGAPGRPVRRLSSLSRRTRRRSFSSSESSRSSRRRRVAPVEVIRRPGSSAHRPCIRRETSSRTISSSENRGRRTRVLPCGGWRDTAGHETDPHQRPPRRRRASGSKPTASSTIRSAIT